MTRVSAARPRHQPGGRRQVHAGGGSYARTVHHPPNTMHHAGDEGYREALRQGGGQAGHRERRGDRNVEPVRCDAPDAISWGFSKTWEIEEYLNDKKINKIDCQSFIMKPADLVLPCAR